MTVVLWMSVFMLGWVYLGYPGVVLGLSRLFERRSGSLQGRKFRVAVVVACHNEEHRIGDRIEDIQRQHSPDGERPAVLVVADRCTDKTVAVARTHPGVDVVEITDDPGGRAVAHNAGLLSLDADLVVFTDAETRFAEGFLKAITEPFWQDDVGCVIGNLHYRAQRSAIDVSERSYFAFERRLREAEGALGILATGTGACMAVRKELYRPLNPTHDVDFITPLDVVFQGYRVVTAPGAVAYDVPPSTLKGEWKMRLRQTSRNLSGTVSRWCELKGWRRPWVTVGLFSHKVLRWLTGYFLLAILGASLVLASGSPLYLWLLILQVLGWGMGFGALALAARGLRLGPLAALGSFLWASLAMAAGCLVPVFGRIQVAYEAAEPTGP